MLLRDARSNGGCEPPVCIEERPWRNSVRIDRRSHLARVSLPKLNSVELLLHHVQPVPKIVNLGSSGERSKAVRTHQPSPSFTHLRESTSRRMSTRGERCRSACDSTLTGPRCIAHIHTTDWRRTLREIGTHVFARARSISHRPTLGSRRWQGRSPVGSARATGHVVSGLATCIPCRLAAAQRSLSALVSTAACTKRALARCTAS